MKKMLLKSICLITVSLLAASVASADSKARTKTTRSGRSFESTTYIKGARQRTEQDLGIGMAMINQCDLKRMIQINDKAKTYMIISQEPQNSTAAPDYGKTNPSQKTEGRKGGVVTYTTTLTDTGERKQIFGLTARHVKSSLIVDSTPESCNPTKMKMETDGWYVDFKDSVNCPEDASNSPRSVASGPECVDEVRYKTLGDAKLGYPVLQTIIIYGDDGKTTTMNVEVLELATKPLEASLFDIPPGYKEAKNHQELMGIGPAGMMSPDALNGAMAGAMGQANGESTEEVVQLRIEPKRPGVIRIGVTAINNKTDRPAHKNTTREQLIAAINSGNVEAVPLYARSSAELDAEAKQNGCDFILYTDIATLKKSGGGGMLGKVTKAAGVNPLKDKFEAKVEYKLYPTGASSPVLASAATVKTGGGVSVGSALQMGMGVAGFMGLNPMGGMGMYGMGGGAGMGGLFMQGGTGLGMGLGMNLMMMGTRMGGPMGGGFGPGGPGSPMGMGGQSLGKEEEAALSSAVEQEAKAVTAEVQKRLQ
jgi:hypothetical protein